MSAELTPAEARVIVAVLSKTWIPNAGHNEFLSALRKLERIASTEQKPKETETK